MERRAARARRAGTASAESVQELIERTRTLLSEQGFSKRQMQIVFFEILTVVHWDWKRPSDRIFETLLDFELADFFDEGIGSHAPYIQ